MLNSLLSKYRLRSKIYATALHMEDGSVTHAKMISDLAVELDEAADELQNYIFPRLDEKYHKILNILMIEYIRAQNWYIGSDIAYIAKPTIRNCGYTADADLNGALNNSIDLPIISRAFMAEKHNTVGFFWNTTGISLSGEVS